MQEFDCKICGTPFKPENGVFICEEGHVSEFSRQEIEIHRQKSNSGYTEKKKFVFCSKIMRENFLKIFYKIYYVVKRRLGFISDDTFKVFLNYFESHGTLLDSLTGLDLMTIIYISLKKYEEGFGNILIFTEFIKRFDKIGYDFIVNTCVREVTTTAHSQALCKQLQIHRTKYESSQNIYLMYLKLNSFDFFRYISHLKITNEKTGNKYYKKIISSTITLVDYIGKDKKIVFKYFMYFVKLFHIRITIKIINDFRWFFEVTEHPNDVFIPELFIVPFLFHYVRKYRTEIDIPANLKSIDTAESEYKNTFSVVMRRFLSEYDESKYQFKNDFFEKPPIFLSEDYDEILLLIFSSKVDIPIQDLLLIMSKMTSKLYVNLLYR